MNKMSDDKGWFEDSVAETPKKYRVIIPKSERIPDERITEEYVKNFKMTETQEKILDLVYRFRMLDTKDLQKALGYKSYGRFSTQLKILHEARFLDRRRRPLELRLETKGQNGENQIFHMLDLAGAYFIKIYYGFEKLSDVKWSATENMVKFEYAVHSLKISEAYARLTEAARAVDEKGNRLHPDDKIIDAWSDKHLYIRYYSGKEYYFYPDMFFKYYRDKKLYGFFVEMDQGTMAMTGSPNTTSFDTKVHYYEGYKATQKTYFNFNVMPKCLVITTTRERAEGLARAVAAKQKEIEQSGVRFLFTTSALWNKDPLGTIFIDQNFEENKRAQTMFD
jgi:hypothetical protein